MTQLVTTLEGFTDSRLQWMFPPKSMSLEQGHLILDTLGGTGTIICCLAVWRIYQTSSDKLLCACCWCLQYQQHVDVSPIYHEPNPLHEPFLGVCRQTSVSRSSRRPDWVTFMQYVRSCKAQLVIAILVSALVQIIGSAPTMGSRTTTATSSTWQMSRVTSSCALQSAQSLSSALTRQDSW
jgi:hypothetical protein